jgi:SSS family solute:Na+ symporter
MLGLHPIDYLVVLIYLVGVLGVGWYFSRQQKQGEDYFLAGRQMPWLAVGLSIVATMLSTVTYLAAPG